MNLADNKQLLIHIAAEALIFLGITLQFNKKYKNLRIEVRELADKVDKLESLLAKNTQMLQNIFGGRSQQQTQRHFTHPPKVPVNTPVNFKKEEEKEKENKEKENEEENESDNESISSSDLDAEISNELKELDLEKNKIVEIKDDNKKK